MTLRAREAYSVRGLKQEIIAKFRSHRRAGSSASVDDDADPILQPQDFALFEVDAKNAPTGPALDDSRVLEGSSTGRPLPGGGMYWFFI